MPTTYAIPDGRVAMAATLYTGTGGTLAVSNAVNGVSFQPDWVWIKNRTNAYNHREWDSVRGVGAGYLLLPNLTDAEGNASQEARGLLTALNSNGFTVGPGSTDAIGVNELGSAFVAWQWKANGAAVTNTAGSITSQVSANTTAGFSVVTYTGTGANATVGHGLGVAPSMVIFKNRGNAADWYVYHASNGAGPFGYLFLNSTDQLRSTYPQTNGLVPTSTVLNISYTGSQNWVNASSNTYVAYCFAAVPGYSAFGSYTGNGSTDGVFVYTGFRPRFLLTRRTDSAAGWIILDSARSPNNVAQNILEAQSAGADSGSTYNVVDFLSNGFKFRITGDPNTSGASNIYMAFAESPFKFANAR